MAAALLRAARPDHHHHCGHQVRTFIDARIKWVNDHFLDKAVKNEKNLKPLLAVKNLIVSQPSKSLLLSYISLQKSKLKLPTVATRFFQNYPLIFRILRPPIRKKMHFSHPHVKLTERALALHNEETLAFNLLYYKQDVADRLARVLMLCKAQRLPFYVIEKFQYDMGLPHDYMLSILPDFIDYFSICEMGFKDCNGEDVFGLELVRWREDLAVSSLAKTAKNEGRMVSRIRFSVSFPRGFDLRKKILDWVEEWQSLPYISPYEDAFHLAPNSDQAEKYAVGVIHELLCLMLAKKTEKESLYCLGDYLGFGKRFEKALKHHPGIFYVSNKISTQTVVLREGYSKSYLIEKHPLMKMRYKYIRLMNTVLRRGRPMLSRIPKRKTSSAAARLGRRKEMDKSGSRVGLLEAS